MSATEFMKIYTNIQLENLTAPRNVNNFFIFDKYLTCYKDQVAGRQHRRCIIPQTVTHSLMLLKMGEIIARNMLS